METMKRAEIVITGVVQGIGFRPFIFNLARSYGLRGWVRNNEKGVLIDAEGEDGNLDRFLQDIPRRAPSLSKIESLEVRYLPPLGYPRFEIRTSEEAHEKFVLVSPDVATCEACLSELFDPANLRYRYPFINCTHCGPRYTIIQDVPYDRHKTTMAPFTMCDACTGEYEDPTNRRFHAQPNACPACGPSLELIDGRGNKIPASDPVETVLGLLQNGAIVAIKGIGGFHLACDATNEAAVSTLRKRKFREDKPFAVMCRDLEEVKQHCDVDEEEAKLLLGVERPIVLLRRRTDSTIAPSVAPYQHTLGVMLPYSPLHHLLLQGPLKALVMTSGNVSDEPIAYGNGEARERLSRIADFFLLHNRDIHVRCDDSVARVFEGKPYLLRRSRGYVPFPIRLAISTEPVLACGAELKNTFCLTRGPYAFMSHHIGDLENLETLSSFEEGIEHFKRLFSIEPRGVAYDLHPDYLSTRYALARNDLPKVGVQHHHAHVVSCTAENGVSGEVIGVALDGTGLGTDNTLWGSEFLIADSGDFRRMAHLKAIPMPGGTMAIQEPWRMAVVYLHEAFGERWESIGIDFVRRVDPRRRDFLKRMIDRRLNTPLTSSMGRLFDAVSALLGIRHEVRYEGQAAVELEAMAAAEGKEPYPFALQKEIEPMVIDPVETVRALVKDLRQGTSPSVISRRFHETIAAMIVEVCEAIRCKENLHRVALSGGVFQNMLLLGMAAEGLRRSGFVVYTHRLVPPNDGGISLGQAVIAHTRLFGCV